MELKQIRETANIELLARQMVEGFITGLHKSPYHGFSVEFAEHRLYNAGESTRNIDWKVYAKTDRLFVKRYEEETNLRCCLLVDNSPSMHYPSESKGKLSFSCLAAASIGYLLHRQRDAVGLVSFAEELELQTEIKSTRAHLHQLFLHLDHLLKEEKKMQKTNVAKVLHEVAERIHKRSLVVIFSDMFDAADENEVFSALQHLRHKQHEVLLFHVTDKRTELDFSFEDRPYEFVDMESGEKIKIQAGQYREYYKKQMAEMYHRLKVRCGQFKIDFIEADIHASVNQVLMSYLIKRARMK